MVKLFRNTNTPPEISKVIPDQQEKLGGNIILKFGDYFIDKDAGDALTYKLEMVDGSPLPDWLFINAKNGDLYGFARNKDLSLNLRIIATDKAGATAEQEFKLTVSNDGANKPPTLNGKLENITIDEKVNFMHAIPMDLFKDPDGDKLSYDVRLSNGASLPAWLTFDPVTMLLYGTAGNDDVGVLNLTVYVDDGRGGNNKLSFELDVKNVNDAPIANVTLVNQEIDLGQSINYIMRPNTFTDVDIIHGDKLTFSIKLPDGSNTPNWITIDPMTGKVTGTPPSNKATYHFKVIATDDSNESASFDFNVIVGGGAGGDNNNPIVNGKQNDINISEKRLFTHTFAKDLFIDPDNDILSYSVKVNGNQPLPSWLKFDPITMTLSGTPGNDDVAVLNLTIYADDGRGGITPLAFNLSVENVNDAPVANGILEKQTLELGNDFGYILPPNSFTDVDVIHGDKLTYSLEMVNGSPVPAWLSIDSATGKLTGSPNEIGDYKVYIIATDTGELTAKHEINLSVQNTSPGDNRPPNILDFQGDIEIREKDSLTYVFSNELFFDPDNDKLSYSLVMGDGTPLPSWLKFDPNTLTLSGQPLNNHVGLLNLMIIATDSGGLSNYQDFQLEIINVNDAPVAYGTLINQTLYTDNNWKYTLPRGAFDDVDIPHGDKLTYTVRMEDGSEIPSWLTIDSNTGELSGKPTDGGTLNLVIEAKDIAGEIADHKIELKVTDEKTLYRNVIYGMSGVPYINGTTSSDLIYVRDHGQVVLSGDGNDKAYGGRGNDEIYGHQGNDILLGGAGNDLLVGGLGNDYLEGGTGSDTYIYEFGHGIDTIYNFAEDNLSVENKPTDKLVIKDINFGAFEWSAQGSDLIMKHKYQGNAIGQITIKDYFLGEEYRLDQYVFADRTYTKEGLHNLFPKTTAKADLSDVAKGGANTLIGNDQSAQLLTSAISSFGKGSQGASSNLSGDGSVDLTSILIASTSVM